MPTTEVVATGVPTTTVTVTTTAIAVTTTANPVTPTAPQPPTHANVVAAESAHGASPAFATCVADKILATFHGADLRTALKIVGAELPPEAESAAEGPSGGARLPDAVYDIEDSCRAVDQPAVTPGQ